MRKLTLALAAATTLSLASAANASITISSCSAGTTCVVDNSQAPAQSTITASQALVPAGSFTTVVDFVNDLAGDYDIVLQSSTRNFLYNTLTITPLAGPPAGSGSYTYLGGAAQIIGPVTATLGTGTFRLTFGGISPSPLGGASTGNITFLYVPVPEPATWALMLLGFGGIGLAMRRHRRPAFAQLA